MLQLKINTRYGSRSSLYLDISCENSQEWKEYFMERLEIYESTVDKNPKGYDLKRCAFVFYKQDKHWAAAVAFAGMCLEAFIYDYAAHNFSDTFVKKYIDKLDLISKWVIVPKLVLQKDFPRDSKAFEYLGKLVKWRNILVHAKSMPMPQSPRDFIKEVGPKLRKSAEQDKYMYEQNLSPFEMVIEVLNELRKLEGGDISTQWWQLGEKENWWEHE